MTHCLYPQTCGTAGQENPTHIGPTLPLPQPWPLESDPKHETTLWSLSWTCWSLWNICSALKGARFINGHRIGMFRDTERPYRRGFLKWLSQYKGRGCVYIWAWAWNNRPDRGRPELEHPTSGWREINSAALRSSFTLHHSVSQHLAV